MPFYFRDDLILIAYTTSKQDVRKKISRMPHDDPQYLDVESFRKRDKSNSF